MAKINYIVLLSSILAIECSIKESIDRNNESSNFKRECDLKCGFNPNSSCLSMCRLCLTIFPDSTEEFEDNFTEFGEDSNYTIVDNEDLTDLNFESILNFPRQDSENLQTFLESSLRTLISKIIRVEFQSRFNDMKSDLKREIFYDLLEKFKTQGLKKFIPKKCYRDAYFKEIFLLNRFRRVNKKAFNMLIKKIASNENNDLLKQNKIFWNKEIKIEKVKQSGIKNKNTSKKLSYKDLFLSLKYSKKLESSKKIIFESFSSKKLLQNYLNKPTTQRVGQSSLTKFISKKCYSDTYFKDIFLLNSFKSIGKKRINAGVTSKEIGSISKKVQNIGKIKNNNSRKVKYENASKKQSYKDIVFSLRNKVFNGKNRNRIDTLNKSSNISFEILSNFRENLRLKKDLEKISKKLNVSFKEIYLRKILFISKFNESHIFKTPNKTIEINDKKLDNIVYEHLQENHTNNKIQPINLFKKYIFDHGICEMPKSMVKKSKKSLKKVFDESCQRTQYMLDKVFKLKYCSKPNEKSYFPQTKSSELKFIKKEIKPINFKRLLKKFIRPLCTIKNNTKGTNPTQLKTNNQESSENFKNNRSSFWEIRINKSINFRGYLYLIIKKPKVCKLMYKRENGKHLKNILKLFNLHNKSVIL